MVRIYSNKIPKMNVINADRDASSSRGANIWAVKSSNQSMIRTGSLRSIYRDGREWSKRSFQAEAEEEFRLIQVGNYVLVFMLILTGGLAVFILLLSSFEGRGEKQRNSMSFFAL